MDVHPVIGSVVVQMSLFTLCPWHCVFSVDTQARVCGDDAFVEKHQLETDDVVDVEHREGLLRYGILSWKLG
jgi:hypothetical protein